MSFEASKILWTIADPARLVFLLIGIGIALLWTRWQRFGRSLVTLVALFSFLITVFPVGTWLLWILENRFPVVEVPPAEVDGIIVLGGSIDQYRTLERKQIALGANAERITAFVTLAGLYPTARLVFSGGSGRLWRQDVKEADVAKQLFADLGLDPGRVDFENQSRNTFENAVLSRKIVSPRDSETWLLITSASHMPRTVGSFRKAAWHVVPYPVDFKTGVEFPLLGNLRVASAIQVLSRGLHEWIGLMAYYLMDRTDALLPGPETGPEAKQAARLISKIDIHRSAALLIDQHGAAAPAHAANRADAMLKTGEVDERAVWRRNLKAVNKLRNTEPGDGVRTWAAAARRQRLAGQRGWVSTFGTTAIS